MNANVTILESTDCAKQGSPIVFQKVLSELPEIRRCILGQIRQGGIWEPNQVGGCRFSQLQCAFGVLDASMTELEPLEAPNGSTPEQSGTPYQGSTTVIS